MSVTLQESKPVWGLWGLALGAAALAIVTLQMSALFAGPEPNPGSTIGAIAGEIREAAARAVLGHPQPDPQIERWTLKDYLGFVAPVLAGLATLVGGIGLYRQEAPRLATIAITFGVSAFVMQYVFWLAVMICGVVLLTTIIRNLDSILDV